MYDFIEAFKKDLKSYPPDRLRRIAKQGGWSLGQLIDHLIAVADEYLSHVAFCAQSVEEQPAGKTEAGEDVYLRGAFPPIRIKLPDTPEFTPSNERSKEELLAGLDRIERDMLAWELQLEAINPSMKWQHGGFGWLNAREWFDLIGMHTRHHFRQKAELEALTA
ncbi:DinB family protein [Paenibacillus rhizovicinus]|uniref:DinB family protein n=1 Tax=Paenibacillus rhizovicinus TaxID=2704463 RepID=A0A6C0P3N7_9BACL|nr:DinB family protein [Paenibacillus rhizovicinus]QHW33087.1 DinB family protein [Paenibacillus rhizovicinus]